jgi:hypothetical protein
MTLSGLHFTRLSSRVLGTVYRGVEYRVRELYSGRFAVLVGGACRYKAESLYDAVEFISDDYEGGD